MAAPSNLVSERDGLFRVLFEHSPDGIVLLDPHDPDVVCPIVACNESATQMNGYSRGELVGQPISVLTRDPATHEELATYVDRLRREEMITEDDIRYRKDGSAFYIEYSTVIITLGHNEFLLGIDRDITERKRLAEALEHQAWYDSLTNLPNRTSLYTRLHDEIEARPDDESRFALLLMDLDRFKQVNDSFGHHVGDVLLVQVAERIRWAVRPSDIVARLGGDEFAVVLPDTGSAGSAIVMDKIVTTMQQPFDLEGHHAEVRVSIGCALYPDHGDDATTLMRRADIAMYVAKRAGELHAIYTPEHEPAAFNTAWLNPGTPTQA